REIAAFRKGQRSFESPEIERLRIDRQGEVHNPIRGLEVSCHLIIEKQILERPGILWVEADRFFEVGGGLLPFPLPTLNGADDEIDLRIVRQTALGDGEFLQRSLIVA